MIIRKILSRYWHAVILAIKHPILFSMSLDYKVKRFFDDILAFFRYYKYPYKIIFVAGMPYSGSTKMKQLVSTIPGYYSRVFTMPFYVNYNQDICDQGFFHTPSYGYSLFKTHLNPTNENLDCIFRNGVEKVLITYRDLRDVSVSRYHRIVAVSKPKEAYDYVDYTAISKEKAIDNSIEIVGTEYVDWIRGWREIAKHDPDRYLFVKFEEMKQDLKGVLNRVLRFYKISKMSEARIKEGLRRAKGKGDFRKHWEARKVLPLGLYGNFRAGTVGHWRNEMTLAQVERCKVLMGDVLIELGYEKDLNWADVKVTTERS